MSASNFVGIASTGPKLSKALSLVIVLSGLMATGSAQAASIGVQFLGGGARSANVVALTSTDTAGLVPQANYNVFSASSAAAAPLNDNTAATSGATLTYGGLFVAPYAAIGTGTPVGPDEKLNNGGLYYDGTSANPGATVTVSTIPYASYDVYVYTLLDIDNGFGYFNVNMTPASGPGGGVAYGINPVPYSTGYIDQNLGSSFTYTQATGTSNANATVDATYARFSGLTASSFTYVLRGPNSNISLTGLQIVELPEPASLTLLGLGGLLLTRRRRV